MNNKIKKLKERYLQFYCELGYEHPDTQEAKREYFEELRKEAKNEEH